MKRFSRDLKVPPHCGISVTRSSSRVLIYSCEFCCLIVKLLKLHVTKRKNNLCYFDFWFVIYFPVLTYITEFHLSSILFNHGVFLKVRDQQLRTYLYNGSEDILPFFLLKKHQFINLHSDLFSGSWLIKNQHWKRYFSKKYRPFRWNFEVKVTIPSLNVSALLTYIFYFIYPEIL